MYFIQRYSQIIFPVCKCTCLDVLYGFGMYCTLWFTRGRNREPFVYRCSSSLYHYSQNSVGCLCLLGHICMCYRKRRFVFVCVILFHIFPNHAQAYSIQHYVMTCVSDLRQVGGFPLALRFPPPIKLTTTI